VPIAALAGILLVVAVRMVDWKAFGLLKHEATVLDFAVMATVVITAVAANLIAAAGAGVALAVGLFIREQIRGSVLRRKLRGNRISSTQHRLPEEQAVLEQHGSLTTVCELQGSLFFGTTDQLFNELEPDLQRCRYLVLDLRRVQSLDYTAAHLFEQFEARLAERDGCLVFSRLPAREDLQAYFAQVGVLRHGRHVRKFETLDDALRWVEDQILAAEMPAPTGAEPPLALGEFELTREFDPELLRTALAPCITERTVPANELVFRQGDQAEELYLIRRGIVRIVLPLKNGGYHNLASFGRGHFFGEIAFLAHGTRSANALATTDADLFVLNRARFDEVSRAHPAVGARFYARLARALGLRLRKADDELRAFYET
jgi:SulP family sulfate permease